MNGTLLRFALLAGALSCVCGVWAQEPSASAAKPEVRLRFDEAQREELADEIAHPAAADTAQLSGPFACKLNRKRACEAKVYDAVTLWNVRKVRIKNRRMRLSDTTRREKVKLLKFFVERDRRKGVRPHLSGNVAGYGWSSAIQSKNGWRIVPTHIRSYTLRAEYDSVRRAGFDDVPRELWHLLSHKAVYILNGERVPSSLFQFVEGLILQRLEVHTDSATMARYDTDQGVVIGQTYSDRLPLVIFDGAPSSIDMWLKLCRVDAFSTEASVPMHYYYMLPLEAVQLYGERGKYGAICIDLVK